MTASFSNFVVADHPPRSCRVRCAGARGAAGADHAGACRTHADAEALAIAVAPEVKTQSSLTGFDVKRSLRRVSHAPNQIGRGRTTFQRPSKARRRGARFVEPLLPGTLFPAAVRCGTLARSSSTISDMICASCYWKERALRACGGQARAEGPSPSPKCRWRCPFGCRSVLTKRQTLPRIHQCRCASGAHADRYRNAAHRFCDMVEARLASRS